MTSPPKNPLSKKSLDFDFPNSLCTTKKSEKILILHARRFAPRGKNSLLLTQVLFGLHYTTKLEPFSNRIQTLNEPSLRLADSPIRLPLAPAPPPPRPRRSPPPP